ncbi:Uncharacterised protein [Serratia marcescens]|nr:Uncharacterised protein [Serratia marcescens]
MTMPTWPISFTSTVEFDGSLRLMPLILTLLANPAPVPVAGLNAFQVAIAALLPPCIA